MDDDQRDALAGHLHGVGVAELANPGITSIYLYDIDSAEIIDTVHAHRSPVVPASSTLLP